MIRLFKFESWEVTVEPEAIMLAPFKALWDRDKSKDKSLAKQELAYIYFLEDPRSDYQYITDYEQRSIEIIKGLGMPKGWKPDNAIKRAADFYKSFKPISAGLLEDIRTITNNLRESLKSMDLNERDDKNKPIYTPDKITSSLRQLTTLATELDEAERKLSKDILADSKARGNNTKALLEDVD